MNEWNKENEGDLLKMIGTAAKLRRLQKNISQEKLAELSGISIASITRFETGRGNISLQNLLSIFKILDMSDTFKAIFIGEGESEMPSARVKERVKWSKKLQEKKHKIHETTL